MNAKWNSGSQFETIQLYLSLLFLIIEQTTIYKESYWNNILLIFFTFSCHSIYIK
jgi:hypothetical protein